MKRTAIVLPMMFLAVSSVFAEDQQPAVKAEEASTLTVYEAAENVPVVASKTEQRLTRKNKGAKSKFGRVFGGGSAKVAGWMISADQVVPSPREKSSFRQ